MSSSDKFRNINAVKPEEPAYIGDDPDARRMEEIKGARHRFSLFLYKSLPWFTLGIAIFVVVLFLFILPITEMSLENDGFLEAFQEWSRAFASTSRTAGIAMATIIISDVMKRIYDYIKERAGTVRLASITIKPPV